MSEAAVSEVERLRPDVVLLGIRRTDLNRQRDSNHASADTERVFPDQGADAVSPVPRRMRL